MNWHVCERFLFNFYSQTDKQATLHFHGIIDETLTTLSQFIRKKITTPPFITLYNLVYFCSLVVYVGLFNMVKKNKEEYVKGKKNDVWLLFSIILQ